MATFRPLALGLSAAALLLAVRPASADVIYDAYMTIVRPDDSLVKGDVTVQPYADTTLLRGYSVAATHETITRPNGNVIDGPDFLSPFTAVAESGSASSSLLAAHFAGRPFKSVRLDVVAVDTDRPGTRVGPPAATWTLLTPYVTGYSTAIADEAIDTYVFGAFAELQYTYYSYNGSGTLQGTRTLDWKLLTNKGTYPVTTTTGTVPDFQFLSSVNDVPVADGVAGAVGTPVPEPASLAAGGTLVCLLGRRRSRPRAW